MNYNSRNEVPEKYKWDLKKWFKSDEEWQVEYEEVKKHTGDLNKYKNKIFESDNLYNLLEQYYNYNNRIQKLYVYAMLKQCEDLSINKYDKMYQQVVELDSKFMENTAFIMPEILHNDEFDVNSLIEKCPKLERYKHILEEFKLDKEYIKSDEIEKIITMMTKDMSYYDNIASNLLDSEINYGEINDETGKTVELNTGNIGHYLSVENRDIRKEVYNKYNSNKIQFANTLGKNLIAFMNRQSTIARIRGYNNTKEMYFKSDYIPIEIHDSLLKNINRGLELFQKFQNILCNILKLEKLEPYDLHASIVKNEKKYTVEEAENYIYNATSILGDEYSKIIRKGFSEHWIDYMPYKGKQSGGFCCHIYGATPNILMSFNGDYTDISTIAHEMGHAAHDYLVSENNNIEYSKHNHYTVEIPSLLNEILLTHYIIENDFSKEEKISVIVDMLRTINANFFTAVMENELEEICYKKIDAGESLNTDFLNDTMEKLINKYYGDTLNQGKYKKYMWMAREHYFTPWYLYKYSTCLCGAVHFATKILSGNKDMLNLYKKYLENGSDIFPNELLLKYGIDLTNQEIYNELFDYYNSLLNKLEELLK